jgi:hypothetical protein
MIEMSLLAVTKETDNKVRWDVDVDGTKFELYIFKWRVPEPIPQIIEVSIEPADEQRPGPLSAWDTESLWVPIITHLELVRWHTKTIRYRSCAPSLAIPVPDTEDAWGIGIGDPYIPIEMTFGGADRLKITVRWKPELS